MTSWVEHLRREVADTNQPGDLKAADIFAVYFRQTRVLRPFRIAAVVRPLDDVIPRPFNGLAIGASHRRQHNRRTEASPVQWAENQRRVSYQTHVSGRQSVLHPPDELGIRNDDCGGDVVSSGDNELRCVGMGRSEPWQPQYRSQYETLAEASSCVVHSDLSRWLVSDPDGKSR
jgi:hypothetical protein